MRCVGVLLCIFTATATISTFLRTQKKVFSNWAAHWRLSVNSFGFWNNKWVHRVTVATEHTFCVAFFISELTWSCRHVSNSSGKLLFLTSSAVEGLIFFMVPVPFFLHEDFVCVFAQIRNCWYLNDRVDTFPHSSVQLSYGFWHTESWSLLGILLKKWDTEYKKDKEVFRFTIFSCVVQKSFF